MVMGGGPDWFTAARRRRLEEEWLPAYLPQQRWFGGKASVVRRVRIAGSAVLDQAVFLWVLVESETGETNAYQLPAVWRQRSDRWPIPSVIGADEAGAIVDAPSDDDFCSHVLRVIEQGGSAAVPGDVLPLRAAGFGWPQRPDCLEITHSQAEQSNTSVRFGDRLILKFYRRIQEGPNPDYEMSWFLAERAGFRHTPALAGGLAVPCGNGTATAAILQEFVPCIADGWEYALSKFGTQPIPDDRSRWLGQVALLGRRTAELHQALASDRQDAAFRPEPLLAEDLLAVRRRMEEHADRLIVALHERSDSLSPEVRGLSLSVLDQESELRRRCQEPAIFARSFKIRCHGDYHLGQVLWTGSDWVILDFEGEPSRSMAERRGKHSPLKDVAGMLRSIGYAAQAALLRLPPQPDQENIAQHWREESSLAFIEAYKQNMASTGLLPESNTDLRALLSLYLLDKALYEFHYELNNRPSWLAIPLQGIVDCLGMRT